MQDLLAHSSQEKFFDDRKAPPANDYGAVTACVGFFNDTRRATRFTGQKHAGQAVCRALNRLIRGNSLEVCAHRLADKREAVLRLDPRFEILRGCGTGLQASTLGDGGVNPGVAFCELILLFDLDDPDCDDDSDSD